MMIFIYIISLLVFLYIIYKTSKDDFVLLRRNVSIEQMFDTSFFVLIASILIGRIVFVILHPSWSYANPLVFFLFPYFPGMSLVGGVVGSLLFLSFFAGRKKMPFAHVADIFSLAYLWAITVGNILLELFLLITRKFSITQSFIALFLFVTLILLHVIFLKGKWKDGRVSIVILQILTAIFLLSGILQNLLAKKFIIDTNTIFLATVFLFLLFFSIKPEQKFALFKKKII
ncbi:MAG: prolipoprotein diacylglyceryl transferase family protein [Candidatus Levyibacteriota bacterium]